MTFITLEDLENCTDTKKLAVDYLSKAYNNLESDIKHLLSPLWNAKKERLNADKFNALLTHYKTVIKLASTTVLTPNRTIKPEVVNVLNALGVTTENLTCSQIIDKLLKQITTFRTLRDLIGANIE